MLPDIFFIGDLHLNINVASPSKHLFDQTVDQRLIAAFKAYYLRTFVQDIATTGKNTQFWKDYNICDSIKILTWAWDDVTKECMNGSWRKTLKKFIHDFKGFVKDDEVAKIKKAVAELR